MIDKILNAKTLADILDVVLSFLREYANYVLVIVCGAIIYGHYWFLPIIGHSDAHNNLIYLKPIWQAGRSLCIPKWQMWMNQEMMGDGFVLPGLPLLSPTLAFAQFTSFTCWVKLNQFLLMLVGAIGVVLYTRQHGARDLWPAVAGIIAMFSGMPIENALTANQWALTVGFIPFFLICIDKGRWGIIPPLTFVFMSCGTLHSAMFLFGSTLLYSLMLGWRLFVRYFAWLCFGLLVSAIQIAPAILNYSETFGRCSGVGRYIFPGWFDVPHFVYSIFTRHSVSLWWPELGPTMEYQIAVNTYSAYIGVVAALCIIVGGINAVVKKHTQAMLCVAIASIIFVCCCSWVWKILSTVPVLSSIVFINAVPTRMIMPLLVFAVCAMAIGMPCFKKSLAVSVFVLVLLTIDYTQMVYDYCGRTQEAVGWSDDKYANSIEYLPKIRVSNSAHIWIHEFVPGNSVYMDIVNPDSALLQVMCSEKLVGHLTMQDVIRGTYMVRSNGYFVIPKSDQRRVHSGLYKIKFTSGVWDAAYAVSMCSILVYVFVFRKKLYETIVGTIVVPDKKKHR